MGVGAGLYMYDVVVKKFTFAISSPDEFLVLFGQKSGLMWVGLVFKSCSFGLAQRYTLATVTQNNNKNVGEAFVGYAVLLHFNGFVMNYWDFRGIILVVDTTAEVCSDVFFWAGK